MVLLGRRRLFYVPIPKNASSTVMRWLFRFEYGVDADRHELHQLWPCQAHGGRWFDPMPDYFSFAILRDPVERFVSGYNNRVLHYRVLRRDVPLIKRLGLSREPDINEFARKLPRYRKAFPDIAYHFNPQWEYLRRISHRLTRYYTPSSLDRLRADVAAHCETDPGPMGRHRTGGHNPERVTELEPSARAALQRWYKTDFRAVPRLLDEARVPER